MLNSIPNDPFDKTRDHFYYFDFTINLGNKYGLIIQIIIVFIYIVLFGKKNTILYLYLLLFYCGTIEKRKPINCIFVYLIKLILDY